MPENLNDTLWDLILTSFQWIFGFLLSNTLAVVGFILAIVIILRVFREQRRPSSILAWSFFIIMIPYVGVPLYIMLGGRKLKKKIRAKGLLTDARNGNPITSPVRDLFYVAGNRVTSQTDGQVAYQSFRQAIQEAQHEIHILTYILSDDEVGNPILDLLISKAKAGVRVRLLLDAIGSFRRPKRKIQQLKDAGGEVYTFMPAFPFQTHGWANLRNHRKIAVMDNRKCIVGGRNLDRRFMGAFPDNERFYDFGATYEGPVVGQLNRIFLCDWAFASKQPLEELTDLVAPDPSVKGESDVTGIVSGPDVLGDMLYERLVNVIQEFDNELTIVTPYFVPDEVLFRSLVVKARRGKRITLILPEKSNWRVVDFVRSQYLRELHEVGLNIQLFQKGMLHAKLMVADHKMAMHGSANFDIRSLFVNFEIGMVHTSPKDIQLMENWIDWLLTECRPFGNERELAPRKPRRILEDAARLIAPLL